MLGSCPSSSCHLFLTLVGSSFHSYMFPSSSRTWFSGWITAMLLILYSSKYTVSGVILSLSSLQTSLPHRENSVCSNDLGLQDMIIDFERNLFGRNRTWERNANTWALENLPNITVFWATVATVAIHLYLSFSFQKFFHTYHSYKSQMPPPGRGWQLFLKTETEQLYHIFFFSL